MFAVFMEGFTHGHWNRSRHGDCCELIEKLKLVLQGGWAERVFNPSEISVTCVLHEALRSQAMCKVKVKLCVKLKHWFNSDLAVFPGLLHYHHFCHVVSRNAVEISELMVRWPREFYLHCLLWTNLTHKGGFSSHDPLAWLEPQKYSCHISSWGSYCLSPYTNEKKLQTCTGEVFIVGINSPSSVVCAAGCLHCCFHKPLKAEDENLQLRFDFDFLFYQVENQTLESPRAPAEVTFFLFTEQWFFYNF